MSIRGEILAINKAAERRLARRTGGTDLLGMPIEQVLPVVQARRRMAIARQVARSAIAVHSDVPVGSRWFDFWFYPVIEPDQPVTEVAIYAREITEQKKSQAELNKLLEAVRQSPMSVVITDRNGVIEYVNPEFSKVSGFTPAEVIGQTPRLLKSGHTPPEQYTALWSTISQGQVWRGEFLNKKKSGELYWELASVAPVRDGETITSYVAVKEDITARKEIEEQLRQSQKMQAIGQLTGGIAHDFNNLLSIILGNLQLLAESIKDDEALRELIDDAQWSARRGGELTHRLLAFARRQPLKPAATDLNDVVRSMAQLLRRTLGARIRIEEMLTPDLWEAFVDRGELERAVVNLAVNARDAMDGEGVLTLETRNVMLDELYAEQYDEVTPGEYVMLAATDTGTGMAPDVVKRAFEPFFTTKAVGQGSGLGLSMVYGFVKQSGGHVSLYSREGYGTSVKLYLPRVAHPASTSTDDGAEDLPQGLDGKLVLVVEDEPKLRRVAVKMLEQLGLRSLQAETAQDALALLADTRVDVLFTDIELPGGMNGTQLADAARTIDPGIKLLFTTGYAREAVLHDRWLREKVPWLLKPYAHQDLARELKRLLLLVVLSCCSARSTTSEFAEVWLRWPLLSVRRRRGRPGQRFACFRGQFDQHRTQPVHIGDRSGKAEAGDAGASGEVAAFRIDGDQPPAGTGAAQQPGGVKCDRLAVVGVHVFEY
ncbi:MAG: PAS domain S-box protein [Defluviicoccus sp.]|nr:MAG: PAS domain S-box protein [Defluviicoccus sp.]